MPSQADCLQLCKPCGQDKVVLASYVTEDAPLVLPLLQRLEQQQALRRLPPPTPRKPALPIPQAFERPSRPTPPPRQRRRNDKGTQPVAPPKALYLIWLRGTADGIEVWTQNCSRNTWRRVALLSDVDGLRVRGPAQTEAQATDVRPMVPLRPYEEYWWSYGERGEVRRYDVDLELLVPLPSGYGQLTTHVAERWHGHRRLHREFKRQGAGETTAPLWGIGRWSLQQERFGLGLDIDMVSLQGDDKYRTFINLNGIANGAGTAGAGRAVPRTSAPLHVSLFEASSFEGPALWLDTSVSRSASQQASLSVTRDGTLSAAIQDPGTSLWHMRLWPFLVRPWVQFDPLGFALGGIVVAYSEYSNDRPCWYLPLSDVFTTSPPEYVLAVYRMLLDGSADERAPDEIPGSIAQSPSTCFDDVGWVDWIATDQSVQRGRLSLTCEGHDEAVPIGDLDFALMDRVRGTRRFRLVFDEDYPIDAEAVAEAALQQVSTGEDDYLNWGKEDWAPESCWPVAAAVWTTPTLN